MHGFDSNWQRMNKQQKEEARGLFSALFGEQSRPEPPTVKYDPSDNSKQNFMASLLFSEGPEREKFEAHQRRLYDQETDRIREQAGKAPRPQTQAEIMQERANRIADAILRGEDNIRERILRGEL